MKSSYFTYVLFAFFVVASQASAQPLVANFGGVRYQVEGGGTAGADHLSTRAPNQTQARLRFSLAFNVDAPVDSGVTLGGRLRVTHDTTSASLSGRQVDVNEASLSATYAGFQVRAGITRSAFDSAGQLYDSEMGAFGQTFAGVTNSIFISHSRNPFFLDLTRRVGVSAMYTSDSLSVRASYIAADGSFPGQEAEVSFSADAQLERMSLSVAALVNGDFVSGANLFFMGARYSVTDQTEVGLQFVDRGAFGSRTTTAVASHTLPNGLRVSAYVGLDTSGVGTDDAAGLGFSYDIGGTTVAGTVQRGFLDETYADLGVRFAF